jgi:uncharacterized membrane protein (UPF0127 family)
MELHPLYIKNTRFDVAIADTEETQHKGLSELKNLGKHKGMLFIFQEAMRVHMVMRDMNFGLDFLFLSPDWKIIQMGSLDKDDKNGITALYPSTMILELPIGTIDDLNLYVGYQLKPVDHLNTQTEGVRQFKSGGRFELVGEKIYKVKVDDVVPDETRLQVLNDKGEVVANIDPGVTIFSREHTKELITKFKKGDTTGLAEAIMKILDKHDTQEQEFVEQ